MRERRDHPRAESITHVVGRMGRERRALLAKKTTVVLLQACALVCLLAATANLAGILPHAVGPALMLLGASAVGFVLSIIEARKP